MRKNTEIIVINPLTKSITKQKVNHFNDVTRIILGNRHKHDFTEFLKFDPINDLIMDERGVYYPERGGFIIEGFDFPIFGVGVIIGVSKQPNDEGMFESCSSSKTVTEIERMVNFLPEFHMRIYSDMVRTNGF